MGDLFMKLPEGFREKFMQQVVSRTSPVDSIRLSSVSKLFQSVADSNFVWDSFIIPEHEPALSGDWDSRKDVFILLTMTPITFNQDKWTGKRRLEMGNLSVTFLDSDYWKPPKTRLRLGHVVWLEIKGNVSTSKLSSNTTYTAYLRFAITSVFYYGFHVPLETSIGITREESMKKFVYFDPIIAMSECQYIKHVEEPLDYLFEVELGDYFHNDGETRDLEITVREVNSGKPKCGIEIYGMELRPKRESINHYYKSFNVGHSYSKTSIKRRDGEMSKEGEEGGDDTNLFSKLPEGLMEQVVSRMSPVDACRLSVVSKSFRSAAESDAVWERLLPNDYQQYLCRTDFLPSISFASKKDLYLFLTGNPLIDANTKGFFFLDKWTGKKCFTITSLSITQNPEGLWNPTYRETSFVEVFETPPWEDWLEIHGNIRTFMLSPDTSYAAYLVYKWEAYFGYYLTAEKRATLEAEWSRFGYFFPAENRAPIEASVGSSEDESVKRVVYLDRIIGETGSQFPVERKDNWLEVELGEYFNKGGENKDLEISVIDVTDGLNKSGFIMQGIEIRPKRG